jgi:hypothetical protein
MAVWLLALTRRLSKGSYKVSANARRNCCLRNLHLSSGWCADAETIDDNFVRREDLGKLFHRLLDNIAFDDIDAQRSKAINVLLLRFFAAASGSRSQYDSDGRTGSVWVFGKAVKHCIAQFASAENED